MFVLTVQSIGFIHLRMGRMGEDGGGRMGVNS